MAIVLLDRRTFTPIAPLSTWTDASWTERWSDPGDGQVRLQADDFPADADAALLTGNLAVQITVTDTDALGRPVQEQFVGPVESVSLNDGEFLRLYLPFHEIRNEIVAEGRETTAGSPATRPLRRVRDSDSQAQYGCRELYVDARQAATLDDLTVLAAVRAAEASALGLQADAGGAISGQGFTLTLTFTDALGICQARYVDATAVAAVRNAGTTAGEYVAQLLRDNLLQPSIDARAADFTARVAGPTAVGSAVDLPFRWTLLSDAIHDVCAAGGIGVRARLVDRTIEYSVASVRDRSAEAAGDRTAILSNVADIDHRVTPGDLVTVTPWLRRDALAPVAVLTHLCTARSFHAGPRRPLTVTPQLGELVSVGRLIHRESRRNQSVRAG